MKKNEMYSNWHKSTSLTFTTWDFRRKKYCLIGPGALCFTVGVEVDICRPHSNQFITLSHHWHIKCQACRFMPVPVGDIKQLWLLYKSIHFQMCSYVTLSVYLNLFLIAVGISSHKEQAEHLCEWMNHIYRSVVDFSIFYSILSALHEWLVKRVN